MSVKLHSFVEDAAAKPSAPIRARKLDENFQALRILESREFPPAYRLDASKEGVRLTNIRSLPPGATAREFDVCENGVPTTYWMLTWDSAPQL